VLDERFVRDGGVFDGGVALVGVVFLFLWVLNLFRDGWPIDGRKDGIGDLYLDL
jgi:hypothetical protein